MDLGAISHLHTFPGAAPFFVEAPHIQRLDFPLGPDILDRVDNKAALFFLKKNKKTALQKKKKSLYMSFIILISQNPDPGGEKILVCKRKGNTNTLFLNDYYL